MKLCEGRVVIITGAGRGIGREHALEFARQGAKVVVNDIGTTLDGQGQSEGPAADVVNEIKKLGGEAVVNADDVADWDGAKRMIDTAVNSFGRLDVLVNNAGFVRDRMFVSATPDEFDAVVRVHLRGHFCTARHAVNHWRERAKAGDKIDARIINTSSGAGLLGSMAQTAYAAAKAGIAAMTLVQAAELAKYNITSNALAPAARTRMTETAFADMMKKPDAGFDAMAPENISPLVAWIGSAESKDVTGQIFEIEGGKITVAEGWKHGPSKDKGARWEAAELGPVIRELLGQARPAHRVYGA